MSGQVPLAGLAVLDLSRGGAATVCARVLAQLGASVEQLDATAMTENRVAGSSEAVVIVDLLPCEARALGLQPRRLQRPGRVVVSATWFGLDGPEADCGSPRQAWAGIPAAAAAALAGAHAAAATLAALRWARFHSRGVCVEVATHEVLARCLGDRLPALLCGGAAALEPGPPGADRHVTVLPCADGYVGVAAPTPVDRTLLAAMVGESGEGHDGFDLAELMSAWLAVRTRSEVFNTSQAWRLPIVPVLDSQEVPSDAQNAARGFWRTDAQGRAWPGSPFRSTPAAVGVSSRAPSPAPYPLSDVRVLDLGMVWAGPYCGRLLAGLGAEVIKVEGPARPDGTRGAVSSQCDGIFADLNEAKVSLVIDLATSAGRDALSRLVARSDALIENFSPRVMPNLGLDHATLSSVNRSLVMLSMPAFGTEGPWANYVAYGSGLELATGLAVPGIDAWPGVAPVAYLDYLAGAYGAVATVAALLDRDATGHGCRVEVAQREVASQLLDPGWPAPKRGTGAFDPGAAAADPHLRARGLLERVSRRRSRCRHFARLPWRLHGVPSARVRPAPRFGADTRTVLRHVAGLAPEEVRHLARQGIVVDGARREEPRE